jgi:hypothetical protein
MEPTFANLWIEGTSQLSSALSAVEMPPVGTWTSFAASAAQRSLVSGPATATHASLWLQEDVKCLQRIGSQLFAYRLLRYA